MQWDSARDDVFITALDKASRIAELENVAIQAALQVHPITPFVLGVDFEPSELYPAISDTYQSLELIFTGNQKTRNAVPKSLRSSDFIPYVHWSLPGKNKDSSTCGVHRSERGDLPVTVCSSGTNDYLKARAMHCWSLRCSKCMNPQALRKSVQMESKVVAPVDIYRRKTGFDDKIKHWALSPPQEWLKKVVQRADHYQMLFDDIIFLLQRYGFAGGCIVFHPWRLSKDQMIWKFSPHFHVVGHGFFNNMQMRSDLAKIDAKYHIWGDDGKTESWVSEQIHPDEKIRSVRYTFAYILTHAGLGRFTYDNDWKEQANDLIIPVELSGNKKTVKSESLRIHDASRSDERLWRESYSSGSYIKELSPEGWWMDSLSEGQEDFDWLRWVKDCCIGDLPVYRFFGDALGTRVLSLYTDRRVRSCPVCGQELVRKSSLSSCFCEPAEYVHNSKIRVMRSDFSQVSDFWAANREAYSEEGLSVMDFAMSIPQCSSPETSGMTLHRPSVSIEDRAANRNKVLVYLWAENEFGLDPVYVAKEELAELRKAGRVYDVEDRDVSVTTRVTLRKRETSELFRAK